MKLRSILKWSLLAIVLSGAGVMAWAISKVQNALVGPEMAYHLENRPEFLTEAMAIELAQQTLLTDRSGVRKWELLSREIRSKAPDGREDVFLSRSTLHPNQGSIRFRCGDLERFVYVELRGEVVICQISIPK